MVPTGSHEKEDGVNRKSPLGIITDRDIAIEIVAEEVNPTDVTVGDMMSRDLFIANDDDDILTTIRVMYQKGVRRLPVVNGSGKLIGIVSMDDLLKVLATELNSLVSLFNQGRHEMEVETEIKQKEAIDFARTLARHVDKERKRGVFDRLFLIAPPRFLGHLRDNLGEASRKLIVGEIGKNLVVRNVNDIWSHINTF